MFYLALWLGKLHYKLLKGHRDSDDSGVLAYRLDRKFIKHVSKPKIVVAVTGTNGKTTTCNFLIDILESKGYKVASNREGANLLPGISKAFFRSTTIFNKSKADIAIIEFDELSTKKILTQLEPDYMIVTNLFLDTMKRNGHTDYVFSKIEEGIPKKTKLILNADDLISSQIGLNNKRILYSINRLPDDLTKSNSLVQDIKVCPKCDSILEYKYIHYHHLGKAVCPKCGFTNYKANYNLTKIDYKNRKIIINKEEYKLVNDGLFNIYNQLVAIVLLKELKIKNINSSLKELKIVNSRYSDSKKNNIEIITQMAKGQNAIAVSRALDYTSKLEGNKEVIIILDDIYDREAKDRSELMPWLYDSDFELLNNDSIKRIVIGGFRAYDYKLRMLMAGIDSNKIFVVDNELETYKKLELKGTDKIVIVHDIYQNKEAKELVGKIKDVIK